MVKEKHIHNKYELTRIITQLPCGTILYRIKALRDICEGVKEGDLGGWVQSEWNLSQVNTCWIYEEAKCYSRGRVTERAMLYNHAAVHDLGILIEDAKVGGTTIIRGITEIGEDTWLYGSDDYNCLSIRQNQARSNKYRYNPLYRGYDEFPTHLPKDR